MVVTKRQVFDEPVITRQRRVKRKTVRKTKAQGVLCVCYSCMVAVAVVVALVIAARYAAVARSSYEMARLQAAVNVLQKDNESLRLEVATMKSPARIQDYAVQNLGMVCPEHVYYAQSTVVNKPVPLNTDNQENHSQVGQWVNTVQHWFDLKHAVAKKVPPQ